MSKRSSPLLTIPIALSLLAGCAEAPSKQTIGTGVGAVGGGLIGSLFGRGLGNAAATAIGGLLGAWAGSTLGAVLDKADQDKADEALEQAHSAPVGQTVSWSNPDSGASGRVTAVAEHADPAGQTCRDYQSTITVDGKDEVVRGTACRQPDGSWAARK